MKKWKFLVATALVCGALTTVTSCIDNDEPAGISDLRGAKAELIKAQAALKLVEVEYQKVNVEIQNIKLEKEKVELQVAQYEAEVTAAKTDYEKELWAQRKDSVINDFQGQIFKLKQTAAENEANYLKALATLEAVKATANDEAFARELGELIGQLTTTRGDVNNTQNEIIRLTNLILGFSSNQVAALKAGIDADIQFGESKIVNTNTILDQVKSLKENSTIDGLKASLVKNEQEQQAINAKVSSLISELSKVETSQFDQEISKLQAQLQAQNEVVTFSVPAAIQNTFITQVMTDPAYTALDQNNQAQTAIDNKVVTDANGNPQRVSFFKEDPIIRNLPLGAYTNNVVSNLLSKKISALEKVVAAQGVTLYRNIYARLAQKYSLPALSTTNMNELTESDITKGNNALEKVNADLTTAKTAYEVDLEAFKTALTAYNKAASEYGYKLQLSSKIYDAVDDAYNKYLTAYTAYENALAQNGVDALKAAYDAAKLAYDNAVKNDATTQGQLKTLKTAMDDAKKAYDDAAAKLTTVTAPLNDARTALKSALTSYYPKRKALDGKVFKATVAGVNDNKEFTISDKLASLSNENFDALAGNKDVLYGTDVNPSLVVSANASENDGALQVWVRASNSLYGTALNTASAETVVRPLDEVNYDEMAGADNYTASAVNYVTLTKAKETFASYEDWNTLAKAFETLATASAAKEQTLVDGIQKQVADRENVLEPMRDKIYEICKLDADQFDLNAISLSVVTEVAKKLGITSMNEEGELQVLEKLHDSIKAAITNQGSLSISYTLYEYDSNTHSLDPKSPALATVDLSKLDEVISDLEESIAACNEYIAYKKDAKVKVENNNLSDEQLGELSAATKEEYENTLANLQERLKDQQAVLDALTRQKDDLIAALGANN